MAQFTYSLDGVLAHRRRLEQAAQRNVAESQAAVVALQGELTRLNEELACSNRRLGNGRLVGRLDLAYLAAHRRFASDAAKRGRAMEQRLSAAQEEVEAARLRLAEAARGREGLAKLRERHLERWRADQARAELAEADDMTSKLTGAQFAEEIDEAAQASLETARPGVK